MNKDFDDFRESSVKPPIHVSNHINQYVMQSLTPDSKTVFLKLTFIQSIIGLMTMLFCPQFNMSLTSNYDLFHYFHHNFGHSICMMICGSIFFGTGAFASSLILNDIEIKKIHESKFLYFVSLSIIFVSSFIVLGAKIYLNLLSFWLLGALGIGITLFEITYFIRVKLMKNNL